MCDYKIIREIGRGVTGTTYIAEDTDKNKFALKLQKIRKVDIDNKNSEYYKEFKFLKKAKKYPDQFVSLHCYEIIPKCDFVHKLPVQYNVQNKKLWQSIQKSPYCLKKVYDLLDGTMDNIKIEHKNMYSMLTQICYIAYLLEKMGYIHNDLHFGNIMYKKVSKTTKIKIFDKEIPTFGYIYKAIDYDDIKERTEKTYRCNDLDIIIIQLGDRIMAKTPVGEIYRLNKQNKMTPWDAVEKSIEREPEYKLIKPFLVDNYVATNHAVTIYMFYVLNENRMYELLGIPKLLPEYKKYITKNWLIPKEDLMFMLQNVKNTKRIVEYFLEKVHK